MELAAPTSLAPPPPSPAPRRGRTRSVSAGRRTWTSTNSLNVSSAEQRRCRSAEPRRMVARTGVVDTSKGILRHLEQQFEVRIDSHKYMSLDICCVQVYSRLGRQQGGETGRVITVRQSDRWLRQVWHYLYLKNFHLC